MWTVFFDKEAAFGFQSLGFAPVYYLCTDCNCKFHIVITQAWNEDNKSNNESKAV